MLIGFSTLSMQDALLVFMLSALVMAVCVVVSLFCKTTKDKLFEPFRLIRRR